MELATLKSHIKTGKFLPYYIFTGPETEVQRIYLTQMKKALNCDVKNLDSILDLGQKLNVRSVLKSTCIYVLRDDKTFMFDDSVQAKILRILDSVSDLVVFVYSNIDKRSKLYKNHQENIIDFEPLHKDILVKYIQRDIDLSESNCSKLVDICESSYSRILLEIDKIKNFSTARKIVSDVAFAQLVSDRTIYQPPYDAVFDFVDAVLMNKPKLAYELLEQSYACGEATLVLLGNLYTSTKHVFQVQTYRGDNLSQSTGLNGFQIKLAKGRVGKYSASKLVELMRLVRKVEKGIKTGEIDEAISVFFILSELWK